MNIDWRPRSIDVYESQRLSEMTRVEIFAHIVSLREKARTRLAERDEKYRDELTQIKSGLKGKQATHEKLHGKISQAVAEGILLSERCSELYDIAAASDDSTYPSLVDSKYHGLSVVDMFAQMRTIREFDA